jgi:hypothetical protein
MFVLDEAARFWPADACSHLFTTLCIDAISRNIRDRSG